MTTASPQTNTVELPDDELIHYCHEDGFLACIEDEGDNDDLWTAEPSEATCQACQDAIADWI